MDCSLKGHVRISDESNDEITYTKPRKRKLSCSIRNEAPKQGRHPNTFSSPMLFDPTQRLAWRPHIQLGVKNWQQQTQVEKKWRQSKLSSLSLDCSKIECGLFLRVYPHRTNVTIIWKQFTRRFVKQPLEKHTYARKLSANKKHFFVSKLCHCVDVLREQMKKKRLDHHP